jgi:hypothetical protein
VPDAAALSVVALCVVLVVVVLCATFRPGSERAIVAALGAVASVLATLTPWAARAGGAAAPSADNTSAGTALSAAADRPALTGDIKQ